MTEVYVTTNAVTIEKVKRSWKERLFTLPWKPLKKYNEHRVPGCFMVGDKLLIHPILYEELKQDIENHKWTFIPYMFSFGFPSAVSNPFHYLPTC